MACLLGIAQASLALLSLRCAIARPKIKLFFSVGWRESSKKRPIHREIVNYTSALSIACMHEIWYMHVPSALHARNLRRLFVSV